MIPSDQTSTSSRLTFLEHLQAFRSLVIWILGIITVCVSIIHYHREVIVLFLLRPLGSETPSLQFLSPLDPLYFIIKLNITLGLLLSLPFIFVILWHFISPALPIARRWVPYVLFLSTAVLSAAAFAYTYALVMPLLLSFLDTLAVPGTINAFTAQGYLSFFLNTTAMLVLVFQIPLFLFIAIGYNVVQVKTIAKNRPYIYLVAVIASAVVTPTTDIFSLGLISLPCIIAIELGTLLGRICFKKSSTT